MLLMIPAARKYQKLRATAEIREGIVQHRMSKMSVVWRRPSLSVIAPLRRARTI
jgi:hypothetical protein